MQPLIFSTGNELKFRLARDALTQYGIKVIQKALEIDEIQSEDAEKIVRDKAAKAYALLQKAVLVSDDSWAVRGLKGWPGPYMSSMNAWLSVDDFLNLTRPLQDRRVSLIQYIVYKDADTEKVFRLELPGRILKEPRGRSEKNPNHLIMTLDGDDGLTVAELYHLENLQDAKGAKIWHHFADWYKSR